MIKHRKTTLCAPSVESHEWPHSLNAYAATCLFSMQLVENIEHRTAQQSIPLFTFQSRYLRVVVCGATLWLRSSPTRYSPPLAGVPERTPPPNFQSLGRRTRQAAPSHSTEHCEKTINVLYNPMWSGLDNLMSIHGSQKVLSRILAWWQNNRSYEIG